MDLEWIIIGTVIIVSISVLVYLNNAKDAAVKSVFIMIVASLYGLSVYFFGDSGKQYFALLMVLAVVIVAITRKINSDQ